MKIGIMSDTHDHCGYIRKAVSFFNVQGVEKVIHAGDVIAPFTYEDFKHLQAPMIMIFGNNDGDKIGLQKKFGLIYNPPYECEFDEKRFLVLHEPHNLNSIIAGGLFDYVIYGHLHTADIREGTITVINPGEVCGWLTGKSTVVILETSSKEVSVYEL